MVVQHSVKNELYGLACGLTIIHTPNHNLDLPILNGKLAHRLLQLCGIFTSILVFYAALEVGDRTGQMDRQTDGRTDGQDPYCGLQGRPHNNTSCGMFLTTHPPIEELFNSADDDFFHRVKNNTNRVLQPHLPDNTDLPYQLRTRSHNMTLINKTTFLTSDDFLIQMLYKYSY